MTVDNLSLSGKVAIVTGSGRETGIGAATAKILARNGAAVTLNYISDNVAARAAAVAESIKEAGGKALVIQANVATPEGAKALVEGTLKGFGVDHIDILINNAGAGELKGTLDTSKEDLEKFYGVNVYGPFFMVQATVPHMPQGGRIINVTSIASKISNAKAPVYGSTKAAVDNLTYSWAEEFGRSKGITVNSIAPGPVITDILLPVPAEQRDLFLGQMKDMTKAADRYGTIEDIADSVLLIVSEKGRWITGQFISVSGGITGP